MTKITLSWMDKIREMIKEGLSDRDIVNRVLKYGRKEELRINKEFEKDERERKINNISR